MQPVALPFSVPEELEPAVENSSSQPFNYFNYFTEIEEAFVARRGSPMMISPMDWSLVESWKTASIPLHVVLRGITQAFDKRAGQPQTPQQIHKKVNTLFYCQQAVMAEFAEYAESQVGAAPTDETAVADPFPPGTVRAYLSDLIAELEITRSITQQAVTELYPHSRTFEAIDRTIAQLRESAERLPDPTAGAPATPPVNLEKLELDLTRLEELLYDTLAADAPPEILEEITADAVNQLKPHKKRMDKAVYEQTLENYRARQLRARYRVPRLSLFYLRPE
ncbi:MAG: hypothetical protein K1Y36_09200 [Blastocatellia bacterium]|nr:hypothetical protein [Blastocatellia bacterium]